MALFVYLSTTSAAPNPSDAQTPALSAASRRGCQNILVLFWRDFSFRVLINQRRRTGRKGYYCLCLNLQGLLYVKEREGERVSNNVHPWHCFLKIRPDPRSTQACAFDFGGSSVPCSLDTEGIQPFDKHDDQGASVKCGRWKRHSAVTAHVKQTDAL